MKLIVARGSVAENDGVVTLQRMVLAESLTGLKPFLSVAFCACTRQLLTSRCWTAPKACAHNMLV